MTLGRYATSAAVALLCHGAAATSLSAQKAKAAAGAPNTTAMLTALDTKADHYADVAKQIWGFAEVGFMEVKSTALLQSELKTAGFTITAGVAGEPTAFVAEYGSGKPVIALLGEFDALPGLSQDAAPSRNPLIAGGPGHGCGHHLFGTASTAAAIALKDWMQTNNVKGTLRMIGTPAEEGGSGKVYMVRDGVFNDVDAVIAWHPGDENSITGERTMANISGKFHFKGISAHAAAAPERGRSALDGVEVMNVMSNYLREHIPDGTRIHYVITDGGRAPNVVPDEAEVYYYVRHVDMNVVNDVWSRVVNAAKGAAVGTGTTYELQLTGSVYSLLPNETLAKVQQRMLERVGGYTLTPAERTFAEQLQKSPQFMPQPLTNTALIKPLIIGAAGSASTDVGDVSWVVPTVQLSAATWVPGTAAHSWQAVAAGGMSIGAKGMMVAAKTMALTGAELFATPATIAAAKAELDTRRGAGFTYSTVLGTQKPALDYRKGSVPAANK
ncbi:amidohydrolase [Gemmatimonas groenlandica]|uniref:Amidohydrolase n=1 Tax=Gemmatimonas groenlandica TaxID=2732249 RepID=A0A6M4IWY0_9BACT|nr:amidohydrolase [Gemmatimonas groenlandica]QJR37402.1 amidohydrolase [Gemmatimonas groenlandica]